MYLKTEIKKLIGRIFSTDFFEKLTEYTILQHHISLDKVPIIREGRELLWANAVKNVGNSNILFIEFGVWKGYSIEYFAKLIQSANSRFYGFDSFEGLPEYWRGMNAGYFNTGGDIPFIEDSRVSFVKGWFQKSLPDSLDVIARESENRSVLIHFDADLYSSTLFLLYTLSQRVKRFHFIFDEFSGHESRALYNFIQASGAKVNFITQTSWHDCPAAVFGYLSIDS